MCEHFDPSWLAVLFGQVVKALEGGALLEEVSP